MIGSAYSHHNASPFCRPSAYNLEAAATESSPALFASPPRARDAFYADNAYAYGHKQRQHSPESASVWSSPAHNSPTQPVTKYSKGKQVLPCFNLLCTGTCAYGPKCTFLHDPRAQLPKHVRKPVEFVLQSHLHTFRPNLRREKERERGAQKHAQVCEEDDSSACTDSDCSSLGHSHSHSHTHAGSKSLQSTFRRDDLFDFPTTSLSYQEPNAKCYDPRDDPAQRAGRERELSMWYHLLGAVSDKNASLAAAEEQRTRLPRLSVFQQLSHGCPVAK